MIFLNIVAFMRDGSDVAGLWEAAAVLASGRIREWIKLSVFNLCFDLLCSASKLPLVSFRDLLGGTLRNRMVRGRSPGATMEREGGYSLSELIKHSSVRRPHQPHY